MRITTVIVYGLPKLLPCLKIVMIKETSQLSYGVSCLHRDLLASRRFNDISSYIVRRMLSLQESQLRDVEDWLHDQDTPRPSDSILGGCSRVTTCSKRCNSQARLSNALQPNPEGHRSRGLVIGEICENLVGYASQDSEPRQVGATASTGACRAHYPTVPRRVPFHRDPSAVDDRHHRLSTAPSVERDRGCAPRPRAEADPDDRPPCPKSNWSRRPYNLPRRSDMLPAHVCTGPER